MYQWFGSNAGLPCPSCQTNINQSLWMGMVTSSMGFLRDFYGTNKRPCNHTTKILRGCFITANFDLNRWEVHWLQGFSSSVSHHPPHSHRCCCLWGSNHTSFGCVPDSQMAVSIGKTIQTMMNYGILGYPNAIFTQTQIRVCLIYIDLPQ